MTCMTVRVAIACNDAWGRFRGEFDCADLTVGESFDGMMDGEPLDVLVEGTALLVAGQRFEFTTRNVWVGNWCWDSFDMSESEARRLFQLLIAKKWTVTEYVHGGMFEDLVEEAW